MSGAGSHPRTCAVNRQPRVLRCGRYAALIGPGGARTLAEAGRKRSQEGRAWLSNSCARLGGARLGAWQGLRAWRIVRDGPEIGGPAVLGA